MIISGHVASISTNEHQSLFSSENNKFILSIPSNHWSMFVDSLYTDENVRSALKNGGLNHLAAKIYYTLLFREFSTSRQTKTNTLRLKA